MNDPNHVPTGVVPSTAKGFSKAQLRRMNRKLDSNRIQNKEVDGKNLSYIQGWYAIMQANEIFGYQGWDRETVHLERIYEKARGEVVACGYIARVSIRVRAGGTVVTRDGTGFGWGSDRNVGWAHEKALKSAETDATKRALATFGSQFGLTLYDKEQNGGGDKCKSKLTLFAPDGKSFSENLSPEAYCSGFRQLIQACESTREIDDLARFNAAQLTNVRVLAPGLRNGQGVHFVDLLEGLIQRAQHRLSGPVPDALEFVMDAGDSVAPS